MTREKGIQSGVRRAAEHCLDLWIDSAPGTGAMMLARYFHACHASPAPEHAAYIAERYRLAGLGAVPWRHGVPFRAPHYTVGMRRMRGTMQRPGEVELAAGGVLMLDEALQFRRSVLSFIRQARETMRPEFCIVATTSLGGDVDQMSALLGCSFIAVRLGERLPEQFLRELWAEIAQVRP